MIAEAAGLKWTLQDLGSGPVCLLLHGTGSSHKSWRELIGPLSERFRVIAPDLPGHAGTQMPGGAEGLSMVSMAFKLQALMTELEASPVIVVGHSAGSAIAVKMAVDGKVRPRGIVSFNGAFLPFGGVAGRIFAPVAKMLSSTGFAASMFARRARDPAYTKRLLASTGSRLGPEGEAHYVTLAQNEGHVVAALKMMASWDLESLRGDLPRLEIPLALVTGSADGTVPPCNSISVAQRVKRSEHIEFAGLGHLAHEEAPVRAADTILGCYERWSAENSGLDQ